MQKHNILEFETPNSNYLILESISNNDSKQICVLNLDKDDEFKIGWGKDSDIWISDISVSWIHAIIKKINGELIIYDNVSKFGTLIMI